MICKCKLVQQKMLGQYVNGLCSKGRMEEASKLVEELLERDLLLGINTDSRLYSEYFRRLNYVGTDKQKCRL